MYGYMYGYGKYGFTWESIFCKSHEFSSFFNTKSSTKSKPGCSVFGGTLQFAEHKQKCPVLPVAPFISLPHIHTHCYLPPPPCSLSGQHAAVCRCVPSFPSWFSYLSLSLLPCEAPGSAPLIFFSADSGCNDEQVRIFFLLLFFYYKYAVSKQVRGPWEAGCSNAVFFCPFM